YGYFSYLDFLRINMRIAWETYWTRDLLIPPPCLSSVDDPTVSDKPDYTNHHLQMIHNFTEITASIQRSPTIPHRRVMLLASGQPIPYGRPYRYHLNGPVHMMTARKRVRPLPTYRLAERHSTDHSSSDSSSEASSDFHSDASSDSSSRHHLPDHSYQIYRYFCGAISQETVSDEPHLEQDSDPEVQAEIDECFAYADALRDRGIDARVVVETIDRDETETGVRGPVEVRVERVTHPVMPEDIPEPAQDGAVETIKGVQREQGHRIVGVESAVMALTERIVKLERDNRRLRGTMSVENLRRVLGSTWATKAIKGGNGNGNGGNGNEMEMEEMKWSEMETKWESWVLTLEVSCRVAQSALSKTSWNAKPQNFSGTKACRMNPAGFRRRRLGSHTDKLSTEVIKMVPDEEDRVERFIGGLPDNIQGNVIAANPTRLQDAIRIANQLMDKKVQGYAARSAENKRRMESNLRDNRGQQPPFKRQNTSGQNMARAYTAGNNERKGYAGPLPYCNKCRLHHEGLCTLRGPPVGNQQGIICYECGRPGHFKKDCPKLRNQNRGNQTRNKNGNKTGNQTRSNKTTGEELRHWWKEGTNPDSQIVSGSMPVELVVLTSYIGMDLVGEKPCLIVVPEGCFKYPYGNEVLIIRGDSCDGGNPVGRQIEFHERTCQDYGTVRSRAFEARVVFPIDQEYGGTPGESLSSPVNVKTKCKKKYAHLSQLCIPAARGAPRALRTKLL
ncbi:putative reverse transcriptase domain-containing protein, partial [Tanacetum coccineum]